MWLHLTLDYIRLMLVVDWGSGTKGCLWVCGITLVEGRNLLIFDPRIENTGFPYLSIVGLFYSFSPGM